MNSTYSDPRLENVANKILVTLVIFHIHNFVSMQIKSYNYLQFTPYFNKNSTTFCHGYLRSKSQQKIKNNVKMTKTIVKPNFFYMLGDLATYVVI